MSRSLNPVTFCFIATLALTAMHCTIDPEESNRGPGGPDTVIVVAPDPDSLALARDGKDFELRFHPRFGGVPLEAGRKYATAGGDSVRIEFAKFYVSEIALIDSTGKAHPLAGLFLADMLDGSVAAHGYAALKVRALPGLYRGLRFSVGVPFGENHRDAATQAPPLGTESGMFWSWNSGYIFNRTEGKVDSAGTFRSFAYHVGGDTRKLQVNLFSLTGTVTSFQVGERGAPGDSTPAFAVNVAYDALFSTGLNTGAALRPSLNVHERQAHGGALLDRIYLNTQGMFARRP